MLIKDFINSKKVCPICENPLNMSLSSYKGDPNYYTFNINLTEKYLNFHSNEFKYTIDLATNKTTPLIHQYDNFLFILTLKCFHDISESYNYDYQFKIINGTVSIYTIIEILKAKDFSYVSAVKSNKLYYTDMSNGNQIILPYIDLKQLPLSKIREKLKTYIILS